MSDDMTTQPTINTVMSRLDELGTRLTDGLSHIREELKDLRGNFAELRTGQDELRKGQDELRKGQDELRKGQDELYKGYVQLRADLDSGLRRVERKIEILNDNLLTIKADIRDLEVRTEKLEADSLTRS